MTPLLVYSARTLTRKFQMKSHTLIAFSIRMLTLPKFKRKIEVNWAPMRICRQTLQADQNSVRGTWAIHQIIWYLQIEFQYNLELKLWSCTRISSKIVNSSTAFSFIIWSRKAVQKNKKLIRQLSPSLISKCRRIKSANSMKLNLQIKSASSIKILWREWRIAYHHSHISLLMFHNHQSRIANHKHPDTRQIHQGCKAPCTQKSAVATP